MTGVEKKVEEFFAAYPTRTFQKGEHLIISNENPIGIFYVKSGYVRVYDIGANGDELVLNIFKSPAFFPISWAISSLNNKYFYQAVKPTAVKIAPTEDVVAFVKNNPDVLYELMQRLMRGTDGLLARLSRVMATKARDRVVLELAIGAKRFGDTDGNGLIHFEITTQELAARTGLARETVSRELTKLRKAGIIEKDERGIHIPNLAALESI